MKRKLKTIRYILLVFSLTSVLFLRCQKDIEIDAKQEEDFGIFFDDFWTKMNEGYVYWDLDKTAWDEAYRKYSPLFKNLKTSDEESVVKAYELLTEMTENMIDGHLTITYPPY